MFQIVFQLKFISWKYHSFSSSSFQLSCVCVCVCVWACYTAFIMVLYFPSEEYFPAFFLNVMPSFSKIFSPSFFLYHLLKEESMKGTFYVWHYLYSCFTFKWWFTWLYNSTLKTFLSDFLRSGSVHYFNKVCYWEIWYLWLNLFCWHQILVFGDSRVSLFIIQ